MRTGQVSGDRIAAEADLATGGPARRTQKSLKSRAEEAAGTEPKPRLIEAGGGKRLIEAGGGNKEGRRIIESSGGRSPTAAEAKVQYESAQEDVDPEADATAEAAGAPPSADETSAGPPASQGDNQTAEAPSAADTTADHTSAELPASENGEEE
jgi:hypothetical protein